MVTFEMKVEREVTLDTTEMSTMCLDRYVVLTLKKRRMQR